MIVATTDGSARSRSAIPHAAAFARAIGEKLILLTIVDATVVESAEHSWPDSVMKMLTETQQELRAEVAAMGIDAEPAVSPRHGGESTADAILRCAAEVGGRMIAMDTRGHGAIRHALLGSVAMNVIAGASIPVMVTGPDVSPPGDDTTYRVLATSDGSKTSERVLTALKPFLPAVHIALLTIYVPRLGDAGEEQEMASCESRLADLSRRLLDGRESGMFVKCLPSFERPETIVIGTASELGANALAMSTQGHNVQHHVLLGSFAAACLGMSPLPVILARR